MSENSLQPIRCAIQIWVEMRRQYEISVVVPQTPFFWGGAGGERGRGTSGGGGVQNVGYFAQANYFTICLTYCFILQQCLIWLHQYVSQIYFDQLYEISFSKVHHVDFPCWRVKLSVTKLLFPLKRHTLRQSRGLTPAEAHSFFLYLFTFYLSIF